MWWFFYLCDFSMLPVIRMFFFLFFDFCAVMWIDCAVVWIVCCSDLCSDVDCVCSDVDCLCSGVGCLCSGVACLCSGVHVVRPVIQCVFSASSEASPEFP